MCYIEVSSSQILDDIINGDHRGMVLGQIADIMYEWEGPVADSLGLNKADTSEIKEAHPGKLKLQTLVAEIILSWQKYHYENFCKLLGELLWRNGSSTMALVLRTEI